MRRFRNESQGVYHPLKRPGLIKFTEIGTFKNPSPGTLVSTPVPDPSLVLGQTVHYLEDPIARSNFRVVVIKPTVVEQLALSAPDTARSWRFTFAGEQDRPESDAGEEMGEWLSEEL